MKATICRFLAWIYAPALIGGGIHFWLAGSGLRAFFFALTVGIVFALGYFTWTIEKEL